MGQNYNDWDQQRDPYGRDRNGQYGPHNPDYRQDPRYRPQNPYEQDPRYRQSGYQQDPRYQQSRDPYGRDPYGDPYRDPYRQQQYPGYQDPYGNPYQDPYYQNGGYRNRYNKQLDFTDAISICFHKYADFNGRASRAEFWWWILFTTIVYGVTVLIPYLYAVAYLAFLVPTLAVCWRRLHDIGRGGGWYFFGLVPLVGWIFMIIWYAKEGEPHPNRFGPNPYGYNDGRAPWPVS